MRILYGIILALLVAFGCQKEPQDIENTQASIFAIPGGQSARLTFYLLVYDGNSPIGGEWGRLEPNAKFDLIETDESGKEIKTWARQVAPDTFRVEGLELGRLYYFKVKAYLGRNYITQSLVVCLSAIPLPTPEVWIPPSTLPFGGASYGVIAPNGQHGVFFQSIDTSSAIFLYEFGAGTIKPLPIQSPIKILWNNNSDQFLIHAYGPAINGLGYGFSQLYLYDLPSDSLQVLTPELGSIIISPHFTTAQDGVQFFTYDAAEKKTEMWRMAFDNPARTAIYPQIIPYLNEINSTLQFEISWDKAGENAFFTVNKDYNESVILHFNTMDNTVTPILADDNWPEFQAYISPTGKNLLFNTPRNGSTELWRYDRTTGQVSQISNNFSGINLFSYYGIHWISDTEFYISGISASGIRYYKIKI